MPLHFYKNNDQSMFKTSKKIFCTCMLCMLCFYTRRCLLGSPCDCSPFWGKTAQKNLHLGHSIFKPNMLHINTCILSKLLHRFQPNFAQWQIPWYHQILVVGGPNMHITNPRWQMAAILTSRKITITQQRFDRSTENFASWHRLTLCTIRIVTNSSLEKYHTADGRHFD